MRTIPSHPTYRHAACQTCRGKSNENCLNPPTPQRVIINYYWISSTFISSQDMTLHRLNHAFAFLFGGYQDYDQFYTPSLLDEDGGLFVAILERLSEGKQQSGPSSVGNKLDQSAAATTERIEGDVEAQQHDHGSGEIEQISQPTMEPSSVSFRMTGDDVNPVRLAAAHVQLKLLKGHNYNIFEAAFFCDPEGDKGEYYLNMLQVIATYLGMSCQSITFISSCLKTQISFCMIAHLLELLASSCSLFLCTHLSCIVIQQISSIS